MGFRAKMHYKPPGIQSDSLQDDLLIYKCVNATPGLGIENAIKCCLLSFGQIYCLHTWGVSSETTAVWGCFCCCCCCCCCGSEAFPLMAHLKVKCLFAKGAPVTVCVCIAIEAVESAVHSQLQLPRAQN